MSKKIKTFAVHQEFEAGPLLTKIYRGFPKFRGYWKLFETAAKTISASRRQFNAKIWIEGRAFCVPVDLRDPYQIDVFARNKEELCVPAVFTHLLRPGDFYFDVGANAGWYCRFNSELVGDAGLVVALEPSERAFRFLTKLAYANFLPLPFAASAINGQILTDESSGLNQAASSRFTIGDRSDGLYGAGERFAVGRSLDHLLHEFRRLPDVVKIDVEGAELHVLRGADKILDKIGTVLVEINLDAVTQRFGYRSAEIYDFMKAKGFAHCYDVRNSDNSVYRLDADEFIGGDILFTRTEQTF